MAGDEESADAVVNPPARSVYMGVTRVEDDVLVDRARCGDGDAFALLYHRYKLDVWNLAYFKLRDHHEAEDSLQETFLKAYRAIGQYRRRDQVKPWLLMICRNVCIDRLRARPKRPPATLDDVDVAAPTAQPEDHNRRIDLRRALAELPTEDVEAFFLVDVMGCRSEEAARIVGVRAPSTLRSRVARARRHIAPALTDPPAPGSNGGGSSDPEIWGLYHAPRENALVMAFVDDGASIGNGAGTQATTVPAGGDDLVGFFDRLDRHIPHGKRIVALVDGSRAGDVQWLAGHPRWQVQHSATWRSEVTRLLGRCSEQPSETQRMLAAIDAPNPFVWTHSA